MTKRASSSINRESPLRRNLRPISQATSSVHFLNIVILHIDLFNHERPSSQRCFSDLFPRRSYTDPLRQPSLEVRAHD